MVNVIDIGIGNVHSIKNWVNQCGYECKSVNSAKTIDNSSIIIPGMCNAYSLMVGLKEKKLDYEIINRATNGQKIIGICAGMQVLSKKIIEDYGCDGLGLINFDSKKFSSKNNEQIINNGWIDVDLHYNKTNKKNLFKLSSERFYFNHQYYLSRKKINKKYYQVESVFSSKKFVSFFFYKNIFGLQFHPEKSQEAGLELGKIIL